MKKTFLSILIIASFIASPAFAQVGIQDVITPQMTIELQPPYPKPGESVTATINDYSGQVYGADITWLLNGNTIPAAQNRRSAIVTAGSIGEVTVIEAVLNTPFGRQEVLRAQINPAYIDMIVEPQTRVPEFYLGRSLPSIGSLVNVTALVYTGQFRNDLVYTWRVNRQVIEGGPIRGRNQVTFETPRGQEIVLSLQVTEPNGRVLGQRSILVPSVQPQMRFYEVSPLLGMQTIPIGEELRLVNTTATVRAEPYHLDINVFNDPDVSEWEINGQDSTPRSGNPYEVTLQRTTVSGGVNLNFHVRDTTQVLQGVESDIQIAF